MFFTSSWEFLEQKRKVLSKEAIKSQHNNNKKLRVITSLRLWVRPKARQYRTCQAKARFELNASF